MSASEQTSASKREVKKRKKKIYRVGGIIVSERKYLKWLMENDKH